MSLNNSINMNNLTTAFLFFLVHKLMIVQMNSILLTILGQWLPR